jgi:hypothetical protein
MLSLGRPYLLALGVAGVVSANSSALAQSVPSGRLYCHAVGGGPPEPLGDKEGHSISVGEAACRVEGGLQDGGVLTGLTIYEWDQTNGVLLSGLGVTRKPGATSAYEHSEGKISLIIVDGKVAGSTFTGRGRITMATGAASSLKGKTYSYSGKTTAPGQFTVDVKYD